MDLSREALSARAAHVLRSNDLGTMTTAAPLLYPHMWSWDAAFIAIGLATVSVDRAITEIDTLLAAQWRNGMIPHIVFSAASHSYFPGAECWESSRLAKSAPTEPETSGICQPPVHALAVQRILKAADRRGDGERRTASDFFDRTWPRLLGWHRWLAEARDPDGVGRVTIHHGWESGMDNSPRWDGPYARMVVGEDLPHGWLLPLSGLLGSVLLLVSDVLGRVVARAGEIQVGIVTAFVGAPFLVALVRRRAVTAP